jgi:magnesium chelatase family protein
LSGPIFDRIDIRLRIQPVRIAEARGLEAPNTSSAIAQQSVLQARAAAAERLKPLGIQLNAQLPTQFLRARFHPGKQATHLLDRALSNGTTSMRGYDRCLRLAWTIADLAGATTPTVEHVAFAALLRGSDSPGDDE